MTVHGDGPSLAALASYLARSGVPMGSSADLLTRRLLPLAAGVLLLLIVFQQLQRVRTAGQASAAVRRYGWGRRLQAGVVGVGYPALLFALGTVLFSVQGPLVVRPSPTAASSGSSASSSRNVPPTPRAQSLLAPDPQAVILEGGDFPGGFHAQRAKPVTFVSAEDSFPSWDVVYEPDSPAQAGDYLLAESLVVVYSSVPMAAGAVEAQAAVARSQQGQQYVPLSKVGDQVTVWVEKSGNDKEHVVVKVTWRYVNVLGQVAILAPASSPRPERALQLARVQQERIQTRSPAVLTLPTQRPS
jgi:hypothetical protein